MSNSRTYELLEEISEHQKQARNIVVKLLKTKFKEEKYEYINTNPSDNYRNYIWTMIKTQNGVYWITMFWNDVDKWDDLSQTCGNCHTQVGRIQFWKDIVITESIDAENKVKRRYSPNNILNKEISKVTLIIDKEKSGNPIDIIKKNNLGFDSENCINRKYITVDDVIENEAAAKALVDAFEFFIKND